MEIFNYEIPRAVMSGTTTHKKLKPIECSRNDDEALKVTPNCDDL